MRTSSTIVLSWHLQRRTRGLARELGFPLVATQFAGGLLRRHGRSMVWTIYQLLRYRPRFVLLEYSYLLLVLLRCYAWCAPFEVRIICDCHNGSLRRDLPGPLQRCFRFFKRWSFKSVDLLVVSNELLRQEALALCPQVACLPDPIPRIRPTDLRIPRQGQHCVVICSYGADEPIQQMIEAAALLGRTGHTVTFTGSMPSQWYLRLEGLPNVSCSGYLSEADYLQLVGNSGCAIVLSSDTSCLMCGGYEALALSVPLVLSDTEALRHYYGDAAIYTQHAPNAIHQAVQHCLLMSPLLRGRLASLRLRKQQEFSVQLARELAPYLQPGTFNQGLYRGEPSLV